MKKAVSVILIISIAVLLVFSLCGCGTNKEDKIIGTWESDSSLGLSWHFITFKSDNTFSFIRWKDNSVIDGNTWSFDKEKSTYTLIPKTDDRKTSARIKKDGSLIIFEGNNLYASLTKIANE